MIKKNTNRYKGNYSATNNSLLYLNGSQREDVIRYQSENNVGRSDENSRFLPTIINNRRCSFHNPELLCYFFQLVNYWKREKEPVFNHTELRKVKSRYGIFMQKT